jgi:hypothetical protein
MDHRQGGRRGRKNRAAADNAELAFLADATLTLRDVHVGSRGNPQRQ